MNPGFFALNYGQLGELLAAIVVLAFAVERALSIIFEHKWYDKLNGKGLKPIIAVILSFLIVRHVDLDLVAIMFHKDQASVWGLLLTAMVIAGGSKGAIKFMKDVLGIEAYRTRYGAKPRTARGAK